MLVVLTYHNLVNDIICSSNMESTAYTSSILSIVSHATIVNHDLLCAQSITRVIDNMRREGRFDGLPTPEEYAVLTGQDRARVISRLRDRFVDEQDVARYSRDKEIDERLGKSFSKHYSRMIWY